MDLRNMMYSARSHFLFSARYEKVVLNVPFKNSVVDMILVDEAGKITTILFADKNWKVALQALRSLSLGSHHAYLCVPKTSFSSAIRSAATQQDIGIYLYSTTGQITRHISSHPTNPMNNHYDALLTAANAKWNEDHTPCPCGVAPPTSSLP